MEIIKIQSLVKSYKDVKAVDGIDFSVNKGDFFAFLGMNGAGKSTTINIMCGVLKKDGGKVEIDGIDLDKDKNSVKRKIGVVFQSCALDKHLTVYQTLESRMMLYGVDKKDGEARIKEVAELFGFNDLLHRTLGKLSGGQRRKIDIARAILHKPEILILDEPTTGLDPQTRSKIWEIISSLRKEGTTVFLTTHYMEEAADADRIVILDKGKIVADGTPLELKNKYAGDYISIYNVAEEDVASLGEKYEKIKDGFKIFVDDTKKATELILKKPELFLDYEIIKGKMDDVFLSATGKNLFEEE